MSMTLTWEDVYEIAQRLAERNPGLSPEDLKVTQIHQLVRDIPEFTDPREGTENGVLEEIRTAWVEELED